MTASRPAAASPHVMPTYGRLPIALSHGQGCRVWDTQGKQYLDALGGIAVNREQSTNLVAASAQALVAALGPLQLIVPPEGTRSKTRYWKTGFYYIAQQAQVPIVLAYMDYPRKLSGLGPVFTPTGDVVLARQPLNAHINRVMHEILNNFFISMLNNKYL